MAEKRGPSQSSPEALTHWLNALPMPALVIDAEDRILALNAEARTIWRQVNIGQPYVMVIRNPQLLQAVADARGTGKAQKLRLTLLKNARETIYDGKIAPVDKGALLLILVDRTEFEAAEEMRRDFVANVSHELRTPLTSLTGFIETLQGPASNDPAAQQRFLRIMKNEAGRMSQLVDDLLSLSRVEENERRRPQDHVYLQDVIAQVISALEPTAKASDVTLAFECAPGLQSIPGDAPQLGQIVRNLVENAIKYGGPGKTVHITLKEQPAQRGMVGPVQIFSVCDEGEGIAAHHIPRLTERFYRVDKHRSRDIGGTGLGLAIVKHAVNRHRGNLKITSRPGQGSCFIVTLPCEL